MAKGHSGVDAAALAEVCAVSLSSPQDPTQLSRAVMSPITQIALSTEEPQLDAQAFVKANSAGAHSCLFSGTGMNILLLPQSCGCGGPRLLLGSTKLSPGSVHALDPAGLPQERAETRGTPFKPPGLVENLTCGNLTCRLCLPDPSNCPTAARKPKQPQTLNLSHCSLFLSSPPDVSSWCDLRSNMDKFLACYFWQLLPPRKEGDYTVGYSGKLATNTLSSPSGSDDKSRPH